MLEHGFTGLTVHAASTPARTPRMWGAAQHVGMVRRLRLAWRREYGGPGGGLDVSTLNDIAGDKQTLSPPLNCGRQTYCPS